MDFLRELGIDDYNGGVAAGRGKRASLLLCFFLSFAVIAGAEENGQGDLTSCSRFFESMEQTLHDAGVTDASSFPVPGAPYLRSTRFLEEMRHFVSTRAEHGEWLDLLYQRGLETIEKEIGNLPSGILTDSPPLLMEKIQRCGDRLIAAAKKEQELTNLLSPVGRIPSEYQRTRKVFGLYPLMTLPIATAIAFYQDKMKKRYRLPLDRLPARGRLIPYAPESVEDHGTARTEAAEILARSSRNPLGIPLPAGKDLFRLVKHYAPLFVQDETGNYDRPGTIRWEGPWAVVDPSEPVVYYYSTYGILRGRPLLQLNYVLWYTRSPRTGLLDIESGRIHGLTLRLTLNGRGEPIMVDVIHNCGCYHFFFPSPKVFAERKTGPFREDAFVPQWLPPAEEGKRLALRIETKRHRAERIFYSDAPQEAVHSYRLTSYDILESLKRDDGTRESIFTPEGILKGRTERVERFFLFSVGISGIGSMRQRGHHPTSLIGERIFDDPRLFEKYFLLSDEWKKR